MISIDLHNKQAVVTGSGRGIGREVALTLARAGANVIVSDIDSKLGNETVELITKEGVASQFIHCDVANSEQVKELVYSPEKLDIFVNIAGIALTTGLLDSTVEEIKRLLDVNVLGTSNTYKWALTRMIDQKHGKIVSMSSSAGREGGPIHAHYRASKAAVISLNQSAAMTGAPYGINVNTVCPGIVYTEMWSEILDGFERDTGIHDREELWNDYVIKSIPMGKPQTPQDVANGILFLCSNLADSITGQALNICGGMCLD